MYMCEGYVEDDDIVASGIPVRLYRRSTGELVNEDVSTSSGTFSIYTGYAEYHYVTALYPTSGTNLIAADWLTPV